MWSSWPSGQNSCIAPVQRAGQRAEALAIEPQSTTAAFDARYPEGADYVVVPAMEPRDALSEGADEIALGLTVDAWSRTALSTVVTVAGSETVRSGHGLRIHPAALRDAAAVDRMLPPIRAEAPARVLDRTLANIGTRHGRPTAEIVALAMEYPWSGEIQSLAKVELQ